ncbi:MAG: translocation/assembly module TamB domain-containing protein [Alphaproteobacteria bacterium]|nr:translocation/assembly module TamB domain-containing protein [Alphaproteobacteria bacterium]
MRRTWKTLALRAAAIGGGILAALALTLLLIVETSPGHAVAAWLVTSLTGGDVVLRDLGGDLPNHLRVGSIELRDAKGAWLRIENVRLDWRAMSLLDNHLDASRVEADRITFLRRHESQTKGSSDFRIDIADFRFKRIDILPAVAGEKAVLTASGQVHYASWRDMAADIAARQLDGDGVYRVNAAVRDGIVRGTATITEKGNGVAGGILGLPTLGPVALNARASARGNANAIAFDLQAGALKATAHGTIDLAVRTMDVAFSATAPAMRPRPDVAWAALAADGRIIGSFDRPQIDAALALHDVRAAGVSVHRIDAKLQGNRGTAELTGVADQLKIPGSAPDVFAASPVRISAQINFEGKARPVSFVLDHPLVQIHGQVDTRGPLNATVALHLPSLSPLSAVAGLDLDGSADLTVKSIEGPTATAITLSGTIDTRGRSALARLAGSRATISASLAVHDGNLVSARGAFLGAALSAHVDGATRSGALEYRWDAAISDMSRLASTLAGTLDFRGTLTGPPDSARLSATGSGNLGTSHFPRENITVALTANGLPRVTSGDFRAEGKFDGAPLLAHGRFARDRSGVMTAILERTEWKGTSAQGHVVIPPGDSPPRGSVSLHIGNLADIAPLLGATLGGGADANIDIQAGRKRAIAKLHGQLRDLQVSDTRVGRVDVDGNIDDLLGTPVLAIAAKITGLQTSGFTGSATATVNGPLNAAALRLTSDISTSAGDRVSLDMAALADTSRNTIVLHHMGGAWRGQPLNLVKPATVSFKDGVSIDRLRLGIGHAEVDLAGRITPKLALTASVTNLAPNVLFPAAGGVTMDGTLSASAELSGSLQSPEGAFQLHGRGLRMRDAPQHAPATLDVTGTLKNAVVALDAKLEGGQSLRLAVKGDVPLRPGHPLDLRAGGSADLGLVNGFLAATGQSLTGVLTLNATVAGTLSKPRLNGTAGLAKGEFRDYANGLRLRDIAAAFEAQDGAVRISQLTAHAGQGTITGSGSVDLDAPGRQVAIDFIMKNAQPLVGDHMKATMNANLKLSGTLQGKLTLSGETDISQGEIRIPDKFPPNVAVLDVRRKGPGAPPPPSGDAIALDLSIASPGRLFVRGRGLDAELAGRLTITGTAKEPQIAGALSMRRGTLSLAGRTLTFQTGKVTFDGGSLKSRLDPTLDFVAETDSGGVTATLTVTGYASAPKIQLSSSPALPQDEILARLLFQQSISQLSPLQLTQIAQAVASLSGVGTGFNPVGILRRSLGLDTLAVGSTAPSSGGASQTTIEAGKYVAHNIYIGATQDLSGGTRIVGQIDITKNLKAQASVNAGTRANAASTSLSDTGDTVGLSYQFEY